MVNLCRQLFCDILKKVLDQIKPFINTFQINLRNVCLSVIPALCLSFLFCEQLPVSCLYRGLAYLLKLPYIILVVPNVSGFSIFSTVFCCGMKILPYIWKKYHFNERHLRLVAHIFTKHSHNMFLINIHILTYWHAKCDCKLWSQLWLLVRLRNFEG